MPECVSKLKAGSEVFWDLRCRTVYDMLLSMYAAKESIDVVTVHQRLKDSQQLAEIGGTPWLASIPDKTPSCALLGTYINIIMGKYLRRQMLKHCTDFLARAYTDDAEIAILLEEFEKSALGVRDSMAVPELPDIKSMVQKRISFYEDCANNKGSMAGIASGFTDLDKLIDGLKAGDMIVLAGRPGMGKTSYAMNIAGFVAIQSRLAVGIFSLEMSSESLVGRLIAAHGRINERNLIRATSTEQEQKSTFTGAIKVGNAPIHIDDSAGLTMMQISARARRMKQQHDIRLIVIDYIQLIRPHRSKPNRQEEVAEISIQIKAMAKELKVPVIAVCQLNRDLEKDKERKPRISDLRESGQLEQDADIIGLLYAPDPVAAAANPDVVAVNLLIAKSRNGPCGTIPLTFFKSFTKFESISRFDAVVQQPPSSWIPKD